MWPERPQAVHLWRPLLSPRQWGSVLRKEGIQRAGRLGSQAEFCSGPMPLGWQSRRQGSGSLTGSQRQAEWLREARGQDPRPFPRASPWRCGWAGRQEGPLTVR